MHRVQRGSFAGRSVVHYGNIGSGNAVIKISATRKRLQARLKKKCYLREDRACQVDG